MHRAARPYPTLAALLGIAAAGAACLAFPAVLETVHHYANFVAVGRSSVKLAAIGAYVILALGATLLPPLLSTERARRLFVRALYGLLALTLLSTIGMALMVRSFGVPADTTFYAAADGGEFSFGHLTHSHLYRPVGYLLAPFTEAEVGTAWFRVIKQFLGVPSWLLAAFYAALGAFAAWLVLASLLYAQHLRGVALKLLFAIASVAAIKSLADGAFLDMAALVGTGTLGVLLRNRVLLLLPLPFLAADAFLWFTPHFPAQAGVALALVLGLGLLHLAGGAAGYRKAFAVLAALACFAAFLWGGARVPFFEADRGSGGDARVIPAGASAYFVPRGGTMPEGVTTTRAQTVAAFVAERDAEYDSADESVKVDGDNCTAGDAVRIMRRVRIFTPSGEYAGPVSLPPWIEGARSPGGYLTFRLAGCTPNELPTLVRGVQSLFPGQAVVVALYR